MTVSKSKLGGLRDSSDKYPHKSSSAKASRAKHAEDLDDSETESNEESDSSSSYEEEEEESWISWFCNLRGNRLFCQVDHDFVRDTFNLTGLRNQVTDYEHALKFILDQDCSDDDCECVSDEYSEGVQSDAVQLYGLIHARYILTDKGMNAMLRKYNRKDFGMCPRLYCSNQPCLPVGESDIPGVATVGIYCPRCENVYCPRSKLQGSIDGAYFGTTFPHLFLMTFPCLKPKKPTQIYVPKIFGFKVHRPSGGA